MSTLHHQPLCPHSRFVRLVLGEMGLEPDLVDEKPHERRYDFLLLNPAGQTPVFSDDATSVVGASVIAEYLDETHGAAMGNRRLMPEGPGARAETRRLMDWFHGKFFTEVSNWLVNEKVFRRFIPAEAGGGGPDMELVRLARANIRNHLQYVGYLTATRNWIAGDALSFADLAAAAHLSCADFLGDVPWAEDESAKNWYARIKSRPAFRPLLADRVMGIAPSAHYADLDF